MSATVYTRQPLALVHTIFRLTIATICPTDYCMYMNDHMNVTQAYSFLDARHIWYPAGMEEWEVIDLAESIARSTK